MTSIIVGMAVTVFAIRFVFIGLAGRYKLPAAMEKALSFSPPVVLAAIVVTTVSGMLRANSDLQSAVLILTSLLTAFALALFKQNLFLAISTGMLLYAISKLMLR